METPRTWSKAVRALIDRIWVWLQGTPPWSAQDPAQSALSNFVDSCANLGVSDVVFPLNNYNNDLNNYDPFEFSTLYQSPQTRDYQRLAYLYRRFRTLAEPIDVHFLIFLPPNAAVIERCAATAKRLAAQFPPRSVHLDAERWWTESPHSTDAAVIEAVQNHFVTSWPRHVHGFFLGIGVTGIASCHERLRPLLRVVDYGIPQMYANKENYGQTAGEMLSLARRHYQRYLQALGQTTSGSQKRIVVGMTANPVQLRVRNDRGQVIINEVPRMQMMLNTVFQLGDTSNPNTLVHEISFWSSHYLQNGPTRDFVQRIAQLARRQALRPGI